MERVTQSLTPPMFAKEAVSVTDIDAWIEHTHYLMATMRCEKTRRTALNPDMAVDYDRYLADNLDDIDFYRWLRKLVDVGGVFHVPSPAASHAA